MPGAVHIWTHAVYEDSVEVLRLRIAVGERGLVMADNPSFVWVWGSGLFLLG